jgi:20S proteasome subunit alpha 7
MTSIGTGYDLSSSTYSPDGRIFQVRALADPLISTNFPLIVQVEYANKAVENSGCVITFDFNLSQISNNIK